MSKNLTELEEFVRYLRHPRRIFWANFWAGTARGLGFWLGTAAVITVSVFVIKQYLSHVPMVGQFFEAVGQWIEETTRH